MNGQFLCPSIVLPVCTEQHGVGGLLIYSLAFLKTPMVQCFRCLDNLHSDEAPIVLFTTRRPRNIERFFYQKNNFSLCKWLNNNIITAASGIDKLNGRKAESMVFNVMILSFISSVYNQERETHFTLNNDSLGRGTDFHLGTSQKSYLTSKFLIQCQWLKTYWIFSMLLGYYVERTWKANC